MIVPNMSLAEIKNSVMQDYETELQSKLLSIQMPFYYKWMRNGQHDMVETISFTTKSKNTWRITHLYDAVGYYAIPYLISYDSIGITASFISTVFGEKQFMHFNTHFFKRYRERAQLNINKPETLVKYFFRKNSVLLLPCYYIKESGSKQLFTPVQEGAGLGKINTETGIYEFKTFIDESLLRPDQQELLESIMSCTMKTLTEKIKYVQKAA